MKALEQQTPRPFTGRHMALILVAFFAVVVGVNVTMAVLAHKSWTGLVVQNSYVASQHFNAETKKRLAMLEKGFRMEIVVRAGSVSVTLNDKAGLALPLHKATRPLSAVTGLSMTLQLPCSVAVHFALQRQNSPLAFGKAKRCSMWWISENGDSP
jgi:nitrogen fixation protein FixH